MSLSMLSSTIQGLEVQRATIATLKSFMGSAMPAGSSGDASLPLEQVLGIKPAAAPAAGQDPQPEAAQAHAAQAASAAQGGWDMLEKQFDSLAAATSAPCQKRETRGRGKRGAD